MGFLPVRQRALPLVLMLAFAIPAWSHASALGPLDDPAMLHESQLDHGRGAGLWVRDGFAYASRLSDFAVINVTDPANPVVTSTLPVRARDVDLLDVGNRTMAVLADGGPRIHFVDVTDPHAAFYVSTVQLGGISHNIAALPGTDLVYNSRSSSVGIDIINVSDPENPFVETVWRGVSPGCHDVTVYPDAGRAYCAAITETFVLDITDPLAPEVLFAVDHPSIQIHHWALADPSHTVLMIGDEAGFFAAEDGCHDSMTTPIGTISDEPGAVWFYDIGTLMALTGAPYELGHVSLPENNEWPCTSHFGDIVADDTMLAVAWYSAGVVLIDWGGPGFPRIVDQWVEDDSHTWDVRYMDGHLYTGDINRGMDVLSVGGGLLP